MKKYKLLTEKEYNEYKIFKENRIDAIDEYVKIHTEIIHLNILTQAFYDNTGGPPAYRNEDIFCLVCGLSDDLYDLTNKYYERFCFN